MEKQLVLDLNKPPFAPIIEEIYENIGELIHFTIVFKGGWKFRGVMTKDGLVKKSMSLDIELCTQPHTNNILFMLEVPKEDN